MIEWGTVVLAVVGTFSVSEIIHLFTIRETKKGMKLDNKQKEDSRWEHLVDQLQDQVEKLQTQITTLNERLEKKDERNIELSDRNAELRNKLDETNTALAKAALLKCTRLACDKRKPPLGYTELSPEEIIAEKLASEQE